ncbi:hypothetical protein [Phyllobacterium sp. YR531]|uniref:hypothetical protein n=1 Tax=Phyllobacterium sp. YR531 TaxID=1144343 RepID=UPI00026FC32E|nr:hypothetical protein [Phyllobacterium sp. YR531]EJN05779.1 hypothetical protein PMI41_00678 [Phyllobacterium sp. YR531]
MIMKFTRQQTMAHVRDDTDFAEWYVEDFMKNNLATFYYEVSDSGKREMTINGRHYAKGFGLLDSQHQAHFITLMWQMGPNFFSFPAFRTILTNSKLGEAEKFDRIYQIPPEEAAVAIENGDDNWWWPEMVPIEQRHLMPAGVITTNV